MLDQSRATPGRAPARFSAQVGAPASRMFADPVRRRIGSAVAGGRFRRRDNSGKNGEIFRHGPHPSGGPRSANCSGLCAEGFTDRSLLPIIGMLAPIPAGATDMLEFCEWTRAILALPARHDSCDAGADSHCARAARAADSPGKLECHGSISNQCPRPA